MEVIIGRDAETSKLRISVAGQQSKLLGTNGSVPNSVSRQHCSIVINADNTYRVKNLKAQNVTFVNGTAVESKQVTEKDTVELGADHYVLEWAYILQLKPKVVDIRPLKKIWEEYNIKVLNMTVKERRANSLRAGTGLLTMGAIAIGFVLGREEAGALYAILYGTAILLTLAFFVKSLIDASKLPREKQKMTEKFQHEYTCPNCGRFFGQPYDQLKLYDSCPYCKTVFRK